MSHKITLLDELNIIAWRAMGQTYTELHKSTGHGNTAIARTLKPDNLCNHVVNLYFDNQLLIEEVVFHKKWFQLTIIIWWLSTFISLALWFI